MRTLRITTVSLALASMMAIGNGPASALEISAFSGYRTGGDFEDDTTGTDLDLSDSSSYGVVINLDQPENVQRERNPNRYTEKQYELFYSHQETEADTDPTFVVSPKWTLNVDYLHIGGLLGYEFMKGMTPFVAAGIGVTRIDPEIFEPETRFSFSLAGGGKLHFNENWGVRLEVRSYWTVFDSDGAVFCTNGSCRVYVRGETWWQMESHVGLFYQF